MKNIPYRMVNAGALTYVAHLACSDETPFRTAAAFLTATDKWKTQLGEPSTISPLAGYLAHMRSVIEAVASQGEKTYIHFYPSHGEIADLIRSGCHTLESAPGELSALPDWPIVKAAIEDQRCGCTKLGPRGTSIGSSAAYTALAGIKDPSEPEDDVAESDAMFGEGFLF